MEQALGVMKSILRSFLQWLFCEPRHWWICIAVIVSAGFVARQSGFSEPSIRLSGLLLQLAGIVTVAWGIIKTRDFFGMPPVMEKLRSWWSRAPFRQRQTTCASASASLSMFGSHASGFVSVPLDSSAPVSEQIEALFKNVELINQRISSVEQQAVQQHTAIKAQVAEQTSRIEDVRASLSERIRVFGTSGLHISAIGAAWLFFGAIMGTASVEIAALLK